MSTPSFSSSSSSSSSSYNILWGVQGKVYEAQDRFLEQKTKNLRNAPLACCAHSVLLEALGDMFRHIAQFRSDNGFKWRANSYLFQKYRCVMSTLKTERNMLHSEKLDPVQNRAINKLCEQWAMFREEDVFGQLPSYITSFWLVTRCIIRADWDLAMYFISYILIEVIEERYRLTGVLEDLDSLDAYQLFQPTAETSYFWLKKCEKLMQQGVREIGILLVERYDKMWKQYDNNRNQQDTEMEDE